MTPRSWAWPSLFAAAFALAAGAGHAQQSAAPEHPIKRGLEAAWTRQPERQSVGLRRDAVNAARRAAQRWMPDAAALDIAMKTDRLNGNAGGREYEATVAIPLWLPGERSRAKAVADADASALDARIATVRLALAEQVRTTYWTHARASQELQLAEERLRSARTLSDDVSRRLSAGDLARADAHQADGAVASAESAAAEAGAVLSRSARRWQALTGLAPLQAADAHAEPMPAEAEVLAAHPHLRELASKLESSRRQRDLASAQRWSNPELAVGAVRERGATGERYAQSVVVGIRIPLGSSSASQGRMATASAEQLEAESMLMLETERIASEVASARDEVHALQASVAAAERRAQLARESRGFFEKSFRLGETDLPTRLRIELEAFEAERQAARARLELSAAVSALRQALGLLPE